MNSKTLFALSSCQASCLLFLAALCLLDAGCSTGKSRREVLHEQGWIGGTYTVVKRFPEPLKQTCKSALLITSLGTNTPARLAGLHEGDLILELDHQPITRLQHFRQAIDLATPGTSMSLKVWQDGQTNDLNVIAGSEKFHHDRYFMIAVPFIWYNLRLWPAHGFSLGVLGCLPPPSRRHELASTEATYRRKCDPKFEPYDEGWKAWLVIFQLAKGKKIVSQEPAPATAPAP